MKLFSRTPPPAAESRPRARPSISSEAQARELRVRARRRLVGASALTLAVIIVVPMLFDATPDSPSQSMIVVPMVVTPVADEPLVRVPESDTPAGGAVIVVAEEAAQRATSPTPAPDTRPTTPRSDVARESSVTPSSTPARPAARAPAEPPRTDDGSVALALLEGRQPPSAALAPLSAGFVLQVAAYNTQSDAQTQRDLLVQSGVTNAYVETTRRNSRSTYRVRVGPFSTREAAQAAQARIRALGDYRDAFIVSQ